jgi:KipI family sensor histidine kinase inhibitor
MSVEFLPCGDTALVVQFGDRIDRTLSERVLRLNANLRAAALPGVVETVPTFRSLMVHYDPLATSAAALTGAIETLLEREGSFHRAAKLWRVPVCYEGDYAPDLEEVAKATALRPEEVVALHSGTRYHVYMIGFLPGYPYMGDLPEKLRLPRRADPRVRVPPGSVAIATAMTAVYTLESPGGWHLIGATPVAFFDPARRPPALLAPGDGVVFEPVAAARYAELREAVRSGAYEMRWEPLAA